MFCVCHQNCAQLQWYENDPRYSSKEEHLQHTGRHRTPSTTYTLLLMSLPTSSLVYPASSVIASLSRELVNVGNSVQFSTGPDEVRPCLYMCSMSWVKLPGQLLLFALIFMHCCCNSYNAGFFWSASCLL